MNTRFPQLIYLKHDTDALTHFSQDGSQIFNSKFAGSGWLLLQNKHNNKKKGSIGYLIKLASMETSSVLNLEE